MENDTTPATKADIRRLDDRMERLEHHLDERFDYLDKYIDQILNILVNDKNRLDEHEKRLARLEMHVGIAT